MNVETRSLTNEQSVRQTKARMREAANKLRQTKEEIKEETNKNRCLKDRVKRQTCKQTKRHAKQGTSKLRQADK